MHPANMEDQREPTKVRDLPAIMKSSPRQVSCEGMGQMSWGGCHVHHVPQPYLGPTITLLPHTRVSWWLCPRSSDCPLESHLRESAPHFDTFGELSQRKWVASPLGSHL